MGLRVTSGNGPTTRAMRRFANNGAAIAGLVILIPVILLVIAYPLILPQRPNDIDLLALNSGPSVQHWLGKGARPSDSVRTLLAKHLTKDLTAAPAVAAETAAAQ